MKNWLLILVLVLSTHSAAVAQTVLNFTCDQEQVFMRLDEVDANQVAVDPETGQRLLVRVDRVMTNQDTLIQGLTCEHDPNSAVVVWRDSSEPNDPNSGVILPVDPNTGVFSFVVRYTAPGIYYHNIGVTDGDKIRIGTYAQIAYENRAPVLSGLPPVVAHASAADLRQQALRLWYKVTNRPIPVTPPYLLVAK